MTFAPSSPASRAPVSRPGRGVALRNAAIAGLSVVATSTIGGLATGPKILGWYAALAKPWYNPPNWVFGPAWTLLFLLMAIAFWRILQTPAGTPWRTLAIVLFGVQLVLNALWSVLFFGMESPALALAEVGPFWLAILATLVVFARIDRIAGWLFVPYLAWVAFAAVLNYGVWSLN
ncbi:TspO/MBR family protein [uncultured Alsobacter sp.]|uniref:TspO/MBR family protein n=1 Tax=uncultured Alsobacter sp. TaxID=1748258 RepID=UPI0025DE6E14|nr:TspO/MBR family protein [uncultured Alsobacter sp.]